jgi:hypothetical protein
MVMPVVITTFAYIQHCTELLDGVRLLEPINQVKTYLISLAKKALAFF